MDVITVSDILDVRDCGGVSEEEPAFIPNSFVIEEIHRFCWSLFTDTQDAMVRVCSVLVPTDSNHGTFTGENNGRVDFLLRRPQDWSFTKFIPHRSFVQNSIHVSHSPLIPGSLSLIVLCLSSRFPPADQMYTPIVSYPTSSLDGTRCNLYDMLIVFCSDSQRALYASPRDANPRRSSLVSVSSTCRLRTRGFANNVSEP